MTIPLALLIAWTLDRHFSRIAAQRFVLAWLGCLLTLLLLKLVFASCEIEWQTGIRSPSGHAGLSTLVYGAWAWVAWRAAAASRGLTLALLVAALVLAIDVSRVILRAHTGLEVVIGSLIGGSFLLWLVLGLRETALRLPLPAARLLGVALLVQLIGQTTQIHAELWVMHWGHQMHSAELCGTAKPTR